jgi:hypothetical protein
VSVMMHGHTNPGLRNIILVFNFSTIQTIWDQWYLRHILIIDIRLKHLFTLEIDVHVLMVLSIVVARVGSCCRLEVVCRSQVLLQR